MLKAIQLENRESYWAMAFGPPLIRQPTMQRVLVTTACSEEPFGIVQQPPHLASASRIVPSAQFLAFISCCEIHLSMLSGCLFIACIWVSFKPGK